MNYEKRFLEIKEFLKEHEYLHELEMLERCEAPLKEPYSSWVEELAQLSLEELIDLEINKNTEKIKNPEFKSFINQVNTLIKIPQLKLKQTKIDPFLKRKMNAKKVYEIQTLKTLIDPIEKITTFIDIGSGAGHLSSALIVDQPRKKSFCIDLNSEFQSMGKEKLKRWTPDVLTRLQFIKMEISEETKYPFSYHQKNTLIIGLHSCGPLSTYLIKQIPQNILNFGCCYHKLKDEYNLSINACVDPLWFTNHALTSASKTHFKIDQEDYLKKLAVKRYRYTLHYILKEKLNIDFMSIGNAKESDYQLEFADYAYKFSEDIKSITRDELINLYDKYQKKVHFVIRSGSLRALLARVIEVYLNLDRVLYLNENGVSSELLAIFDKEISPRNLCILSSHLLKSNKD